MARNAKLLTDKISEQTVKDEHRNISRDISCPCRMLQLDKDVVRACLPVTRDSLETISFAFLNQVRKARFKIIRAQITNYKSIKLRSDFYSMEA